MDNHPPGEVLVVEALLTAHDVGQAWACGPRTCAAWSGLAWSGLV
ncbi:hypothetical protein ACWIG5_12130 [Streptomyces lydicus]